MTDFVINIVTTVIYLLLIQEAGVKKLFAALAVFTALVAVSSCTGVGPALGGGYTVSGTITLQSLSAPSPATITAQQGALTYTTQVTVPAADVSGVQSFTFTLNNVPAGTYDVIATITTPVGNVGGTYSVNGGAPLTITMGGPTANGLNWDWTGTVSGTSIQADVTVDVTLQNRS
jgi:hypothetical protein